MSWEYGPAFLGLDCLNVWTGGGGYVVLEGRFATVACRGPQPYVLQRIDLREQQHMYLNVACFAQPHLHSRLAG